MTELKPCPFCGCRLVKSDFWSRRTETVFEHPVSDDPEQRCFMESVTIGEKRPDRIEAWNRRALDGDTIRTAANHLRKAPSFGDGKWAAAIICELIEGEDDHRD